MDTSQERISVGLVGLGKMGGAMCRQLLRSGWIPTVFDVDPLKRAELGAAGADVAESLLEVVEKSRLIVLSLPDAPVVERVVLGATGLCHGDLTGKIVVDTSTVTRPLSVRCADAVAGVGGHYLDAPVTGGVYGARAGKLVFFVGGDAEAYHQCEPLWKILGQRATLVGPSGHGQVVKLVFQMVGSIKSAIAAEALAVAEAHGVAADTLAEALGVGHPVENLVTMRESGDWGNEGYLGQRGKDLDYAVELAREAGIATPVNDAGHQRFVEARARGLSAHDPNALYLCYRSITESKTS